MFNENDFSGEDVCKITGTLVKAGPAIDDKGTQINVSPEIVRQIYTDLMQRDDVTLDYDDLHDDGIPVAKTMKYKLSDDGSEILYKGVVHDPKRYQQKFNEGFKYTSPVIEFHRDGSKIIHGRLLGAAMALNPGMVLSQTQVETMNFSAPTDGQITESTQVQAIDWSGPFGKIETKIDEMGRSISDIGAKLNMTNDESQTESQPTTSQTPEVMRDMIKDVLLEVLKTQSTPTEQQENTSATSDVDVSTDGMSPEIVDKITALIKKIEATETEKTKLEQENRVFKDEKARTQREEYLDLLKKGREIGIEKPEEIVKDPSLSEAQKIAILKASYKTIATNNPIQSPPKTVMSDQTPPPPGTKIHTVDSILHEIGISSLSDEWRTLVKQTGLFDDNDKLKGYN